MFTHLLLLSREKPLVIPTAPGFSFSYICFAIYFSFAFLFRSIKPKIQKYFAALYFIYDVLFQSITNIWLHYPKGIDNPFNTSARCCLRCVAWFSYWFDNLGFFTEGNTYRCCAASSLPLWGNTDVVQATSAPYTSLLYWQYLESKA